MLQCSTMIIRSHQNQTRQNSKKRKWNEGQTNEQEEQREGENHDVLLTLASDAICSPELLMRCLADRLGGVRAGANGQRGHLRHHPGILRGLRLQRRLQLATVVNECGGAGGGR